jgi:hypothetical protein
LLPKQQFSREFTHVHSLRIFFVYPLKIWEILKVWGFLFFYHSLFSFFFFWSMNLSKGWFFNTPTLVLKACNCGRSHQILWNSDVDGKFIWEQC